VAGGGMLAWRCVCVCVCVLIVVVIGHGVGRCRQVLKCKVWLAPVCPRVIVVCCAAAAKQPEGLQRMHAAGAAGRVPG
jgi:hypothetical protein